jgi:hypothetical protein
MNSGKCGQGRFSGGNEHEDKVSCQKVLVFQQNGSGESKIRGIRQHGDNQFLIVTVDIDENLPSVLDDTAEHLTDDIEADLVLDFLKHPDLSLDLAVKCRDKNIPMVASGKKIRVSGTLTPPT